MDKKEKNIEKDFDKLVLENKVISLFKPTKGIFNFFQSEDKGKLDRSQIVTKVVTKNSIDSSIVNETIDGLIDQHIILEENDHLIINDKIKPKL